MENIDDFRSNIINVNNLDNDRELLAHNEKFKVVYFKFEENGGLPDHVHNGFATIQVISGMVDIEFKSGEKFRLSTGDFLPFDARIEHNVIARELSKVLVTISQSLS